MSELTKEQIEAAAEACANAQALTTTASIYSKGNPLWPNLSHGYKETYRLGVVAAAKFLQLPWDEPTLEELQNFQFVVKDCPQGNGTMNLPYSIHADIGLIEFVRRRNIALISKPADPRMIKLTQLIRSRHPTIMFPENFVCQILDIVDGKL